jgi:small subunit ribosomal protein S35
MKGFRGGMLVTRVRLYSQSVNSVATPLYLNPHAWHGLPADQIFELHQLRKESMGEKYNPNDDERNAILSTINSLSKAGPALDYVYEIDNFKERYMNNVRSSDRGIPQKRSNIFVLDDGKVAHEKRRNEQLNRVAAYEMPLLAKFRQSYQPKSSEISPIKLTYQTDFSDESNSFNRKVVLQVNINDLQLNDKQKHKFKLLSGSKFNYDTNVVKIKCNSFPEPTQNARFAVDTLNKLLTESKDLTEDFADIPLDSRHMKINHKKPLPKFPDNWKRPQDAPIEKHKIINKLTAAAIKRKDQEFINKFSP